MSHIRQQHCPIYLSGVAAVSPFIAYLSTSMSLGFVTHTLDFRYPQKQSHTERSGERAGHGIPSPLEVTNAPCAAVHCSIATKMMSVKPVTDGPASRLIGSGTNLLRFKTRQVPVTRPV